ncbi:MAG: Aldehyde dehydrogenase A [uncultured Rubellimicrobium sp.]|uniref:Aldehyde dehydrogenase A n=1 Tax=uncultured Rubellimicrobium sp. TaxID=543078 RepID=A0A6J4PXG2_9RHOB|nr:MAG: Aldehyde dehydrogenase A [uncultured Rubellimicrobium sp.]
MLDEFRQMLSEGRPLAARMFIDGQWQDPQGLAVDEVEDPATGRTVATTPQGTRRHAEEALETARKAQVAWARVPAVERGRAVSALADAVRDEAELLARIVVAEQGKPLGQARGEIGATETFLRFAAEWARRIEGEILPSDAPNEEIWIRRLPHGVVAGLTAWNYPSALATRKLGPALVAGNSFVLKAHEFTPLSGLALAALGERVGLPKGLFNVVTGDGRNVGRALVEGADMTTMTGSTRAGREIYAAGAAQIKNLRLELGGKAPFIVMEDADIARAVDAAVAARFTNCGQICTCNERMYLHEAIADEFLARFVEKAQALSIGPGLEDPDLGPKISGGEVEKVEAITAASIAAGAEVLLRGGPLREGRYEHGHFMSPTVLTVRSNDVPVMKDEVFGPVVAAQRVGSYEEALTLANDTEYGLSAYVWSANLKRVFQAAEGLHFGEIYCNRTNGELVQGFHTGWGLSGLGGEDGKHGFDGYLRKKTMYVNWS